MKINVQTMSNVIIYFITFCVLVSLISSVIIYRNTVIILTTGSSRYTIKAVIKCLAPCHHKSGGEIFLYPVLLISSLTPTTLFKYSH